MKAIESKLILTGILPVLMIISGIWLSKSGKPYHPVTFNVHKLISVGVIVLMTMIFYPIQKNMDKNFIESLIIILSAIFFLFAIITGGMLSVGRSFGNVIETIHKVLAILILVFSALAWYFFRFNR